MFPALVMNTLFFPIKWLINLIRSSIYNTRGAIDTSGIYIERDKKDNRLMILEVEQNNQKYRVRLYVDFDNNYKSLSKLTQGDTVLIRWIPGAKWAMGRK